MEDIEKKFWEALTAKVDTGLKKFSLSEIYDALDEYEDNIGETIFDDAEDFATEDYLHDIIYDNQSPKDAIYTDLEKSYSKMKTWLPNILDDYKIYVEWIKSPYFEIFENDFYLFIEPKFGQKPEKLKYADDHADEDKINWIKYMKEKFNGDFEAFAAHIFESFIK